MSTSLSEPAPSVAALYFDGRSARAHPATLTLRGHDLHLNATDLSRIDALSTVRLSEPMGQAARIITYEDGAHVEVRDHAALAVLLAASGQRDSAVVRWAFQPRAVLAMLAGLLCALWFAWQFGLPWAARLAAPHVPDEVVTALSQQTLAWVDGGVMTASTLDAQRQQALRDALAAMVRSGGLPAHALIFRSGGAIGANAFALPDGTLIVTDQLVALAGSDDEVLAVLLHELGHVRSRHGMRMLLQGSVSALFMAWYLGDVSSLLAMAPTALIQAGYSRDMEREADDFAARMLRRQGLAPALLADMLEKLAGAHDTGDRASGSLPAWLSSHPDTSERIAHLRSGDFMLN
ncbi:MAG TPA: M48 family metallopeptidase [Methyloversatilis sp.]